MILSPRIMPKINPLIREMGVASKGGVAYLPVEGVRECHVLVRVLDAKERVHDALGGAAVQSGRCLLSVLEKRRDDG